MYAYSFADINSMEYENTEKYYASITLYNLNYTREEVDPILVSLYSVVTNETNCTEEQLYEIADSDEVSEMPFPYSFFKRITCKSAVGSHEISVPMITPDDYDEYIFNCDPICSYISDYDVILATLPDRNNHERTYKPCIIPSSEIRVKDDSLLESWLRMHSDNPVIIDNILEYPREMHVYMWYMSYKNKLSLSVYENRADRLFSILNYIPLEADIDFYEYIYPYLFTGEHKSECAAALIILAIHKECITDELMDVWYNRVNDNHKNVLMLYIHIYGLTRSTFKVMYKYMTITGDLGKSTCFFVSFPVLNYVHSSPFRGGYTECSPVYSMKYGFPVDITTESDVIFKLGRGHLLVSERGVIT